VNVEQLALVTFVGILGSVKDKMGSTSSLTYLDVVGHIHIYNRFGVEGGGG
jgi:hypothetical protein